MNTKCGRLYEILIADDNAENLYILEDFLKNEGYKVHSARNGKQVLSYINISKPDLLIIDVHMPIMDGLEVCKNLKKPGSQYKDIPVIFLSALNDTFNKLQAFDSGAVDYITKPYYVQEVLARVKIHLQYRYYFLELIKAKEQVKQKEKEIEKLKQI